MNIFVEREQKSTVRYVQMTSEFLEVLIGNDIFFYSACLVCVCVSGH